MTLRTASRAAISALVLLLAGVAAARAQDAPKDAQQPAPDSPAARVAELTKEFNDSMQAFQKKYSEAKTDEERSKIVESDYPNPEKYVGRFMAIAKEHPKDPASFDALMWVVQRSTGQSDANIVAAIEQLSRDHVTNPKLAAMIPSLVYGPRPGRALLEAVLEKNPDKAAKGQACLALAQMTMREIETARRVQSDPEMREGKGAFANNEEFARLAKLNVDDVQKQAEALFERVAKEFGDVKGGRGGTLGESAAHELFEIRNLSVGKVAPDIEGEDIDGKPFKLSDYRGKVVLLDFWGDW